MSQPRHSISRQLLIILVLFAAVPVSLLSLFTYFQAKKNLVKNTMMRLEAILQDQKHHVEIWFKERSSDFRMLSQFPTIRDMCEKYRYGSKAVYPSVEHRKLLEEILKTFRKNYPFYEGLYILSPSGKVLASTRGSCNIVQAFENKIRRGNLFYTKKLFFFDLHRHKNKKLFLHVGRVVETDRKGQVGFVLADVDIRESLERVMKSRSGLGKTGEAYVIDEHGVPLTALRYLKNSDEIPRVINSYAIEKAIKGGKGSSVYKNYAGRRVVGSYLWLPEQQWAIIVEIGEGEIMRPVKSIRNNTLFITFGSILLCFIVSLYASYRISRPVKEMTIAAERMARGELEQRVSYPGANEIGLLAQTFNDMSDQLSETVSSLKEKEEAIRKAYDELVRAQERLVQSEKLAAIGELIASIVHEMRNPLSSIKLNLQILGRNLDRGERAFEHYEIASSQVKQLEKMFSDLLNYSKPVALEPLPVYVTDIIDSSLEQIRQEIVSKNIKVHRKVPDDLPRVFVDPDKVTQVFVNVLKNAVDSLHSGGTIDITGDVVERDFGRMVTVIVSDNGPGLTETQLNRVFEPFFTTKEDGTGLGLSIVKKIVDAHQGKISVTSNFKQGTRVIISFPAT